MDTCQQEQGSPRATSEQVSQHIRLLLAGKLGLAPATIGPGMDLIDAGVDSVLARHLLRSIEETFGVALSGRALHEHRTVSALACHAAHEITTTTRAAIGPERHDSSASSDLQPFPL